MVWLAHPQDKPLDLVVTGEAESWLPALGRIVGPRYLRARQVGSDQELLDVVQSGQADAAVLDDDSPWDVDVLKLLRMLRRVDQGLPVVVVTTHTDRRWLEHALALAAFSVVVKPLELEELLRQIHGMMDKLSRALRQTDW